LSKLTTIYFRPEQNVPLEARDGWRETLVRAINVKNRASKITKFGFSTSEDALTWTVFTYLAKSHQLGSGLSDLGILEMLPTKETLILWGVPIQPEIDSGRKIVERLISLCDGLGEDCDCRSEPDVIADVGNAGLVIIEVKYQSMNSKEKQLTKFSRYLDGTSVFVDPDAVRASRLYELTRNWRLGCDLAATRPFTLVNLVLRREDTDSMNLFLRGIATSPTRRFVSIKWKNFAEAFSSPLWLRSYLRNKQVLG
jgi:hypothetical protein